MIEEGRRSGSESGSSDEAESEEREEGGLRRREGCEFR